MGPNNITTRAAIGRLKQMGPADFLVTFRSELRDNEVAFFVGKEVAIPLLDDKGIGPAFLFAAGGRERFPDAIAVAGFDAAKLTITADAVDVFARKCGRAHDAVKGLGVPLILARPAPELFHARFVAFEFEHQ